MGWGSLNLFLLFLRGGSLFRLLGLVTLLALLLLLGLLFRRGSFPVLDLWGVAFGCIVCLLFFFRRLCTSLWRRRIISLTVGAVSRRSLGSYVGGAIFSSLVCFGVGSLFVLLFFFGGTWLDRWVFLLSFAHRYIFELNFIRAAAI